MKNFTAMTTADISARIRELSAILEMGIDEKWDDAYSEYTRLNDILDERYRAENQNEFNAFYEKHIKGKSYDEIRPEDWDFYSDWHKDMYGFRPRHT